jgi:hypothetical protein
MQKPIRAVCRGASPSWLSAVPLLLLSLQYNDSYFDPAVHAGFSAARGNQLLTHYTSSPRKLDDRSVGTCPKLQRAANIRARFFLPRFSEMPTLIRADHVRDLTQVQPRPCSTIEYASHKCAHGTCTPIVRERSCRRVERFQVDVALVGVPFDGGVTNRTSARLGPRAPPFEFPFGLSNLCCALRFAHARCARARARVCGCSPFSQRQGCGTVP